MKGGKPTPTPLRILRARGKEAEKLVARQIETPGHLTDPPDWFNAEQKADWSYAIENAPRNVLRRIDKAVLAGFVVAQDIHRRACVALAETQLLVKSPSKDVPIQNPYLPIIKNQTLLMVRAASELGFTPCSRARIEAGQAAANTQGGWEDVA
jgi:P27 family predicted phage terminase small subunit